MILKNAKVSDFGGVSLGASFNTTILVGPNVPEAHRLTDWWRTRGQLEAITSLSMGRGGGGVFGERGGVGDMRLTRIHEATWD